MALYHDSHKCARLSFGASNPVSVLEVRLGEKAYSLEKEGDQLVLDGNPIDARLERLNDNSGVLFLDGNTHVVSFEKNDGGVQITIEGISLDAHILDETALLLEKFGFDDASSQAGREVHAPMPGLVLNVLVSTGDTVEEGQGLIVLEAMKMENELKSQLSGTVGAIHVEAGAAVAKNALLIELEAAD